MKTIELESKTDSVGILRVSYPLHKKDKKVKVIIMYDDSEPVDEEKLWLTFASQNPAFEFLNDENEDVYSFDDGELIDA